MTDGYFHILIGVNEDQDDLKILMKDLDLKGLKKRFITPYLRGKKVLSENTVFDTTHIRHVKIIKTNKDIDSEIEKIREARRNKKSTNKNSSDIFLSGNILFDEEAILTAGKDVTLLFVDCAPGEGDWKTRGATLLQSLGVPGIISGLVLTLIIAWLNLN